MKTLYRFSLVLLCLTTISYHRVSAQGCVAVRHMSCTSPLEALSVGPSAGTASTNFFKQRSGHWQVNVGYRYFRSFRHFKGDVEQKERLEQHTEVVNISHGVDLGLTYLATTRLSFSINLPVQYNDRSSLYEHYGNSTTANPEQRRFHTGSQGIGDLRLSGSYWLRNPTKGAKANFALGAGIKLPTGNPGVEDNFHKLNREGQDYIVRKPVDQSIQLGDGGVGFSLEGQGYAQLTRGLSAYVSGFYLFNPRETNRVLRSPEATTIDLVTGYFSVADQFAARLGLSQTLPIVSGLSVMLGGRVEGVPANDALGGSKGFRRPGYIVSVEPGLSYMRGKFSGTLSVPVALYRNRIKSYSDRLDPLGQRHGDAAFADYLVSLNVSRWF
ncbi:hypothetical protein [Tellurirhabdus rosea]|uniref:hypothetical protein n=1 Tax=Tellurirhabdus rosea TaxID=2674997 RepID=UPI00225079D0|nr:hypothetical protein [Tellurirhabdus rosea]